MNLPAFKDSSFETILDAVRAHCAKGPLSHEDSVTLTKYLINAKELCGGKEEGDVDAALEQKLVNVIEQFAYETVRHPETDENGKILKTMGWIANHLNHFAYMGEPYPIIYVLKTGEYHDYTGQTQEQIKKSFGKSAQVMPITPSWEGELQPRMNGLEQFLTFSADDAWLQNFAKDCRILYDENKAGQQSRVPPLDAAVFKSSAAPVVKRLLLDLSQGVSETFTRCADLAVDAIKADRLKENVHKGRLNIVLQNVFAASVAENSEALKTKEAFLVALPVFIEKLGQEKRLAESSDLAGTILRYFKVEPAAV